MTDTCHLVLDGKWFDKIKKGEKNVEYRDDKPYYRKRLEGKKTVTLHRGYTKNTLCFQIRRLVFNDAGQIEIHLGEKCP